jgi:hypothetical protein
MKTRFMAFKTVDGAEMSRIFSNSPERIPTIVIESELSDHKTEIGKFLAAAFDGCSLMPQVSASIKVEGKAGSLYIFEKSKFNSGASKIDPDEMFYMWGLNKDLDRTKCSPTWPKLNKNDKSVFDNWGKSLIEIAGLGGRITVKKSFSSKPEIFEVA